MVCSDSETDPLSGSHMGIKLNLILRFDGIAIRRHTLLLKPIVMNAAC